MDLPQLRVETIGDVTVVHYAGKGVSRCRRRLGSWA
jgi:hypothetical protein